MNNIVRIAALTIKNFKNVGNGKNSYAIVPKKRVC